MIKNQTNKQNEKKLNNKKLQNKFQYIVPGPVAKTFFSSFLYFLILYFNNNIVSFNSIHTHTSKTLCTGNREHLLIFYYRNFMLHKIRTNSENSFLIEKTKTQNLILTKRNRK